MSTRINKLNDGFVSASSNNLPVVDFEMFMDFIEKSINSRLETQGWKMVKTCRANYGDNAIGYVQVKRINNVVHVIAKITPEHKLRNTPYSVEARVDEKNECIQLVKCYDCVARQGVCKHAVAFAMWLHRRTEEPSPTSVHCYWKKSILSTVKDQGTFLKATEINRRKNPVLVKIPEDVNEKVLQKFLEKQPKDCQLYLHINDLDTKVGSIHSLVFEYYKSSRNQNAQSFLRFAEAALTDSVCKQIEVKTKEQSKSPYWYEIRYGRVTASKIYEVCHCHTESGSLVNQILGVSKFKGNWATKRGLELENKVMKKLEVETRQNFEKSGFVVNKKYPYFGASPDGLSDTHVVEIKCPAKASTVCKYITSKGDPNPRYFAQIQTQMFLTGRRKGYFCVADPEFEKNSKITYAEVIINKNYCKDWLTTSKTFWVKNIYPRLKRK